MARNVITKKILWTQNCHWLLFCGEKNKNVAHRPEMERNATFNEIWAT